jgi:hypothetical protein
MQLVKNSAPTVDVALSEMLTGLKSFTFSLSFYTTFSNPHLSRLAAIGPF